MTDWRPSRTLLVASLSLGLLTLLLYLPALGAPFVYDDVHSIVGNPSVRSWSNIAAFFTDPRMASAEGSSMYRPILLVSFTLNHSIAGYEPFTWHLTNILIHACNAVLLMFLARRLSGSLRLAIIAGILFAAHPLASEPAIYISSRSSSLMTLFFLAALLAVCRAARQQSHYRFAAWSIATYLLFAAALLVKISAITLPIAAGLCLFVLAKRDSTTSVKRALWMAMPLLLLGIVFAAWRGYRFDVGSTQTATDTGLVERGPWENLLTQVKSVALYAKLAVLPVGQSFHHEIRMSQHIDPIVVGCSLVLLVPLIVAGLLRKTSPLASVGIVWFFVTVAPTSSVIPLNLIAAERRAYLPLVGVCLATAVLLDELWKRRASHGRIIVAIVLLSLSGATVARAAIWRNPVQLFEDAVRRYPNSFISRANLGVALASDGQVDRAIESLERAVEIAPKEYFEPRCRLGEIYRGIEDYAASQKWFSACLTADANNVTALANLAQLRHQFGDTQDAFVLIRRAVDQGPRNPRIWAFAAEVALESNELELARSFVAEARRLDPEDPAVWRAQARLFATVGRHEDAAELLGKVAQLRASCPSHFEHGALLARAGRYEEAIAAYERCSQLDPAAHSPHVNIANALFELERYEQALAAYDRALERGGESWILRLNQGLAYERLGSFDSAASSYSQALRLAPESERATLHRRLGLLYLGNLRDVERGEQHLRKALELEPNLPDAEVLRKKLEHP